MAVCSKCGKSAGIKFTYDGVDSDNNPIHYCDDCNPKYEFNISSNLNKKTINLVKIKNPIKLGFCIGFGIFLFILVLWLVLIILSLITGGIIMHSLSSLF